MRLTELEPQFITWAPRSFSYVETMGEADGVLFLCPVCFAKNSGPVGTHSVICWFSGKGVPPEEHPGPGRWEASGTGYADLTLAPSVHLSGEGGCGWHGFVQRGDVT
jgi:hypothetical protein